MKEISRVRGSGGRECEGASVATGDDSKGSEGMFEAGVVSAAVASARDVEAKEEG
jgi:hypothetical protein